MCGWRHAEELLWVVVIFQVDLGSTGGLNVACRVLTSVIMSQMMFTEENGKAGKKTGKSA